MSRVYQSARPSSVKRDTARITNVGIAPQQKDSVYLCVLQASKHTYCYSMITLAFIVHAYLATIDRCTAWVETFCLWVLARTSCYKRRVPSRGASSAKLFNVARSEHALNDAIDMLHCFTELIENGALETTCRGQGAVCRVVSEAQCHASVAIVARRPGSVAASFSFGCISYVCEQDGYLDGQACKMRPLAHSLCDESAGAVLENHLT